MANANEKGIRAWGRLFVKCFGVQVEAEAEIDTRRRMTVGQPPEQAVIEDQSHLLDDDIVEDVDPAEVDKLDKI